MGARNNIAVGTKFNNLTFLGDGPKRNNMRHSLFRCDCGNETSAFLKNVLNGHTTSCGCNHSTMMRQLFTTHGSSKTVEYRIWRKMFDRCYDPRCKEYPRWGGRGITICAQWSNFETFFADMGRRPSILHSIERNDNALGYSKANCRWATPKEQANNTRRNVVVAFEGRTQTLAQWAEEFGLRGTAVYHRFHSGWPLEKMFRTPVRHR